MANGRIRFFILTVILILLQADAASSGTGFSCRLNHDIVSFSDNDFQISSPCSGSFVIKIFDQTTVYQVLEGEIKEPGTISFSWDGTGFNEERLDKRTYQIDTILTAEDGTTYQDSFSKASEYSAQAVNYALPSSDCILLDDADAWFIETKTVMDGTLTAEWIPDGSELPLKTVRISVSGGKAIRIPWKNLAGHSQLESGFYTLKLYDGRNPGYGKSLRLQISEQAAEVQPVEISEDFYPDEADDINEIWRKMMLPSVVVNIGFHQHQKIYEEPDNKSKSLGTVHGQTQALKILEINDRWARVGAWNHEAGMYVEGWVPVSNLKTEYPQKDYGLLFSKEKQELTVFYRGKILDVLKISTGLGEKEKIYQETPAGSYLTGYHRNSFSSNGKKFDYVIQYDGGNMIHQIPYFWGNGKKDFAAGLDQLGNKASHGCIRIQAEPSEKSGINAYWLWTHIPYHTRIIILDNP